MKIAELLNDVARRHAEFPVCAKRIFLAHAAVSPMPRRVTTAMQEYLTTASEDDQEGALAERVVGETRQLAAQLLDVRREEIAFTGSTSMGLGLVATGLDWRTGDNVVCYRDDYPANVYPWMGLAERGVEVRFVEPRTYGRVMVEDLERVVDRRTRLVALASVHFIAGWRLAVETVGKYLRERGVLFCLDGIQSFGALRTSLRYVDFAAADAHKWLLGPLGIALLYVRRENFDRLRPALVGWHNAICPNFVAQDRLVFWPSARRYEPGSLNITGIVGLRAALELILECGVDAIEERVLMLARAAIERGQAQGLQVIGPTTTGGSGIVSFELVSGEDVDVQARLTQAGIVASVRATRRGVKCVRLSPHFYNLEREVEAAVGALVYFRV